MRPRWVIWAIPVLLLGTCLWALAEEVVLTTYYPSPRGVYKDMKVVKELTVGSFRIPHAAPTGTPFSVAGASVDPARFPDLSQPTKCPPGTDWYDEDLQTVGGASNSSECKPTGLVVTPSGSVGIGTASPAAAFEVASKTSGLLPPRMTTEQRQAIVSPVQGLVIYNTSADHNQLEVYDGTDWKAAGGGTPHGMQVYSTAGTFTFDVPSGVSQVTMELWGGGGGGGAGAGTGSPSVNSGIGGSGGGFGREIVSVIPGSYTVVVGAAGLGRAAGMGCNASPSIGTGVDDGGNSSFSGHGLNLIAYGGGGAGDMQSCNRPGGTSTLRLMIRGADGQYPPQDTFGGGDGGAGGNGGAGGSAAAAGCSGAPGQAPGGGGAGGDQGCAGGAGAPGKVVISW